MTHESNSTTPLCQSDSARPPEAVQGKPELLTAAEVAALLGCSMRTVIRLADAGRMPRGAKLGGLRRWRRAELAAWLDDGCPAVRVAKGPGQ